jgi:hypothetical protein
MSASEAECPDIECVCSHFSQATNRLNVPLMEHAHKDSGNQRGPDGASHVRTQRV